MLLKFIGIMGSDLGMKAFCRNNKHWQTGLVFSGTELQWNLIENNKMCSHKVIGG